MTDYEPLDYRLRCHTKRTDLPPDVLRDICEAYEYMQLIRDELTERIHMCDMRSEKILELTAERDEARRECRLLLLGQEVLRGVRDLPAPPDDLVTIVPVPRKEDGK
jgi:hypothetical protein